MTRVIIKAVVLSGIGIVLFACANGPATDELLRQGKALFDGNRQKQLTSDDIGAGLKEALYVGTETVVAQLGRPDGFHKDRAIHIPLPDTLANVKSKLGRYGLDKNLADLELRLNRAAETATPLAKELFWKAIRNLSWSDIQGIYHGQPDAATRYFQTNMSPELAQTMRPVVEQALAKVGAIRSYDNFKDRYAATPFMPDIKSDLASHTVDKSIDGIFYYLAKEEAAIRRDPMKRTTEILKKVFGG